MMVILETRCEFNNKCTYMSVDKHQRKPQRQSRMENPETLATLGTKDTRRREAIHIKDTRQKTKKMSDTDHTGANRK